MKSFKNNFVALYNRLKHIISCFKWPLTGAWILQLAVFTENGLGKRMKLSEFVSQSRGGKGVICYKPNASTGDVVAGALVSEADSLLINGSKKSICIGANDISTVGRTSIGVQLIKEGCITSISKI